MFDDRERVFFQSNETLQRISVEDLGCLGFEFIPGLIIRTSQL